MNALGVTKSIISVDAARLTSSHRAILRSLTMTPITTSVAREIISRNHYLHSFPGGTMLSLGIFFGSRLLGAITLGAGPYLGYRLVEGARRDDCITLTRLWLSDQLPLNSESRVLGMVLRGLRKDTSLKFVLAYSDPAAGHTGVIYQATGWLYTGLSSATPLYDFSNGTIRHSRSLAHELGSHSVKFWQEHGFEVKTIPQMAKHRYIYFLDPSWRSRLSVSILPYPKKEIA